MSNTVLSVLCFIVEDWESELLSTPATDIIWYWSGGELEKTSITLAWDVKLILLPILCAEAQ